MILIYVKTTIRFKSFPKTTESPRLDEQEF